MSIASLPTPVRSWSFVLPGWEAPPAGLSANFRGHWSVKMRSTAAVRAVVAQMAEWEALIPSLEKCRVDVTWFVNTRTRRDTDNLAPLLKAIYDGLGSDTGVSARIVPDDAPAFMEKPEATIIFDKKCKPHFRVTITELTR